MHLVAAAKAAGRVTGSLTKSNFAVRFVGAVAGWQDAQTASDLAGTGAERLAGRGDFIVRAGMNVRRFQVPSSTPRSAPCAINSPLAGRRRCRPARRRHAAAHRCTGAGIPHHRRHTTQEDTPRTGAPVQLPLPRSRPPTPQEAAALRSLYAEHGSKNKTLAAAYGTKSPLLLSLARPGPGHELRKPMSNHQHDIQHEIVALQTSNRWATLGINVVHPGLAGLTWAIDHYPGADGVRFIYRLRPPRRPRPPLPAQHRRQRRLRTPAMSHHDNVLHGPRRLPTRRRLRRSCGAASPTTWAASCAPAIARRPHRWARQPACSPTDAGPAYWPSKGNQRQIAADAERDRYNPAGATFDDVPAGWDQADWSNQ